jgi:hypothetical protein
MESISNSQPMNTQISPERRLTLEKEYEIGFQMFQMQNSQAWTTFSIVSTLSLAALVFVGQFKSYAGQSTWPLSVPVGLAMMVILIGWLLLASRWRAYADVYIYQMRKIEAELGMYLIRQGTWLRKPLKESEIAKLNKDERSRYEDIRDAFRKFPSYRLRQQRISLIIVTALIAIWFLFIVADIFYNF